MFTGLIREVGVVNKIIPTENGKKLFIQSPFLSPQISLGDSISVNGVCLTVEDVKSATLQFHVISTSLDKTSLRNIKLNSSVNLEPCLTLQDPLGGHLVSGHVNSVGEITEIEKSGTTIHLWVSFPAELRKYMIKEGSVALDGISLTIADLKEEKLKVSIIPHTWDNTNLKKISIGDTINIEVDLLAKYMENLIKPYLKEVRQ